MNILYYIPRLSQRSGGIRQYAAGLLKTLAKFDSHTFYVLHNNNDPEILNIVSSSGTLKLIPKKIGVEKSWEKAFYRVCKGLDFILTKKYDKEIRVRSFLDRICKKYNIDIVHSPFQHQPFPSKTKNIFTLHDMQELHFPEYFTPEQRERRARDWLYNIKETDEIVVSYDHIKKDIIKYFGVDERNIHVILLDMKDLWFDQFSLDDKIESKEKHDFDKFLLYPANTWEHKNHKRLLNAIALLRDKQGLRINLVCVGHQNDQFEHIKKHLSKLNLISQIKFLGIVDEKLLYSLYQDCTGVIIPTLYEAGSFPLMESMLMNIPVICSNVTSLPETIGNPEFIFDPCNPQKMAKKMKLIYIDKKFRANNINNSKKKRNELMDTGAFQRLNELYNSFDR